MSKQMQLPHKSPNRCILMVLFVGLSMLPSPGILLAEKTPQAEDSPRIWILSFNNTADDSSIDILKNTLPELLEVFFSHTDHYTLIDRQHLDTLLAERSLTWKGLTSGKQGQNIGKLLGATVMVSGGFIKKGGELIVTAHAYEVGSSRLLASTQVTGKADNLAPLVNGIFTNLVTELKRVPKHAPSEVVDQTPISNLHFMRGLSYYYSAGYNQALGEFMQAGKEKPLSQLSRLWMANCYLAQKEYGHAYIELKKLSQEPLQETDATEVKRKLKECVSHLTSEEIRTFDQITTPEK